MKLTQPVAQYEQVARELRQRILDGEWAPGVTLPGAPAVSREYRVTQSVAQRALELLVAWRLVRTDAGRRGTVILPLRGYRAEMPVRWAPGGPVPETAVTELRERLAEARGDDPLIEDLEAEPAVSAGVIVSAVVTAVHAGHAADRLGELARAAAGKGWDLTGASVSAEPAGADA